MVLTTVGAAGLKGSRGGDGVRLLVLPGPRTSKTVAGPVLQSVSLHRGAREASLQRP